MDVLESPLNLAHQQSRKAESSLHAGKFLEAIEHHQKAAEYLCAAQKCTNTPRILESLSLQQKRHERQQDIIRLQQKRAETLLKLAANQNSPGRNSSLETLANNVTYGADVSIYRTEEEYDSLFQILSDRLTCQEDETEEVDNPDQHNDDKSKGVVQKKNDSWLLEELKTLNEHRRQHISDLVKKLEDSQKDNVQLREKNITYEEQKRKDDRKAENMHNNIQDLEERLQDLQKSLENCQNENIKFREQLKSQYIVRQSAMKESDETEKYDSFPLGVNLDDIHSMELPPLEMPQLDYDALGVNKDDDANY